MAEEELEQLVVAQAPQKEGQDKWLLDTFSGISPLVARELAFRSDGTAQGLAREMLRLRSTILEGKYEPVVLKKEGKETAFSYWPILQYGPSVELTRCETFSQLLDD